jgi:hypothetical protein
MQTGAQAAPHDPQQQQQQPDATAVPDEQHPAAAEDLDAEDAAAATSDDEDDDDDYNQRNFGIFQALPVDGEPDWSLSECVSFCVGHACRAPTLLTRSRHCVSAGPPCSRARHSRGVPEARALRGCSLPTGGVRVRVGHC